jgi:uncharacterized DUF497 family protein
MEIEYDPRKNAANINERGLSFDMARDFEWPEALTWRDTRKDYSELRVCALVPYRRRIYAVTFTPRGETMRIISLRKANKREESCYEKEKN